MGDLADPGHIPEAPAPTQGTVAPPGTQGIAPPKMAQPRRRVAQPCGHCNVPCGQPARLYPCGWRCDDHSPGAIRARAAAQ
jgi:hypothetical protein